MIVVDSNIIAYLCLGRAYWSAAAALLDEQKDYAAPTLWRSELRNVLAGFLRRGELGLGKARSLMWEAEALMGENEYEVDSRTVLDLVNRSDCSAYDCEFVALAMQLDTKLVTMDRRVLRAFPEVAVPLIEV